jgi:hypothetical protein
MKDINLTPCDDQDYFNHIPMTNVNNLGDLHKSNGMGLK